MTLFENVAKDIGHIAEVAAVDGVAQKPQLDLLTEADA